ncbi:MAG: endonuclease/exonuclease/phosphatase family protein, partial [Candidatus Marinimicrobia bacterium]|nr:endonuclease/exonuclease/phosphatase family protein [Candidatus Neomarinimicrobiota bacterium]
CSANPESYSIMTYNIWHGVGIDRILDLPRTAGVIQAGNPDFVILNEVDAGTARSFAVQQADSLGKLLGLHALFGRSIDYDGGQYGNALLSRYPIVDFHIVDLSADNLLEGRSVFISRVDLLGDTITIMGTHLGLSAEEQHEQVARIINALPEYDRIILAGDFNFEDNSENYLGITNVLRDGLKEVNLEPSLTFPADKPVRRIDYIFIGAGIEALESSPVQHIERTIASDHQPQLLHFK